MDCGSGLGDLLIAGLVLMKSSGIINAFVGSSWKWLRFKLQKHASLASCLEPLQPLSHEVLNLIDHNLQPGFPVFGVHTSHFAKLADTKPPAHGSQYSGFTEACPKSFRDLGL